MPTVEVTVPAHAEHVRVVRVVAAATARLAGVDDAHIDDVRLAVDEACARAVQLGGESNPDVPVLVRMDVEDAAFTVTVSDAGGRPAAGPALGASTPLVLTEADVEALPPDPEPAESAAADVDPGVIDTVLPDDFGLALVRGLADDVRVTRNAGGADVAMSWAVTAS